MIRIMTGEEVTIIGILETRVAESVLEVMQILAKGCQLRRPIPLTSLQGRLQESLKISRVVSRVSQGMIFLVALSLSAPSFTGKLNAVGSPVMPSCRRLSFVFILPLISLGDPPSLYR